MAQAANLGEKENRKSDGQKGEGKVDAVRGAILSGRIFVVVVFPGVLGGGLVGFGFDAVFLEKRGDLLILVLELQSGEVADHRGADLVCELGGRVDELLLCLQLLLLTLNGQLMGLDFILLGLESACETLVAPVGYKKPKT